LVTSIAALASALKQQQLGLEVGTRLLKTATDSFEDQGDALVKLLESTKAIELELNPHLGSTIDIRG